MIIDDMHKTGDKQSLYRGQCPNRGILMVVSAAAVGKGAGVLDRPVIERTSPGRESEFDLRYMNDFGLFLLLG